MDTSTTKKTAAFTLLAIALLAGSSRAKAQDSGSQMVDPGRVVLTINGEEIKGAEYYRRMEYLPEVGQIIGKNFSEFPPGFITIQKLINERLTFALAKQKGVYPTDEEVDNEIKIREVDKPTLLKDWIAAGGNVDELKYLIRFQLSQFKIATFGVTITDAEVEAHYKDKPDLYTVPKMVSLSLIAVASNDDTQAVDNELASGKSFADVAKAHSLDVSKSVGGKYGTIEENRLSQITKDAIDKIKIGETTSWLSTSPQGGKGAYFKFRLDDVTPPKKLELDDRLRREIRRSMMLDRGSVKNADTPKEMDALRLKAKIDIKQQEFADAYKKFMDAYFQQRGPG